MNRMATHRRTPVVVGLMVALALSAPVAAHAASAAPAGHGGGLGWREGLVALAIVLGVLLLGVWGDRVLSLALTGVDTAYAGVAAAAAAASRRTSRKWRQPSSHPEQLRPAVSRRR